eukprot:TRINITY_DN539_c0_g1_i5.p2 TRINITY_DN539_c0_g1~~TRINITY_DN539_c0_g1_i5.p2  ORF type:complete len:114 (-),score=29.53 TRINITY_DN539_c0_g1_i5:69-410(-)
MAPYGAAFGAFGHEGIPLYPAFPPQYAAPYGEDDDETPYLNQEEAAYYDMWLAQQGGHEEFEDDEFMNDGEEFFSYSEYVEEHVVENEGLQYGQVEALTRQMQGTTLSGTSNQ